MRISLVSLTLLFLVVGCNDPEAPAKCRAIGEDYCAKVAEFCVSPEAPPLSAAECEETFNLTVVCDDALYIDDEDNECPDDIDAIEECTFGLPASCLGVVVVAEKPDVDENE